MMLVVRRRYRQRHYLTGERRGDPGPGRKRGRDLETTLLKGTDDGN